MIIINWLNENIERVLATTLFMIFSGLMIVNVLLILIARMAISWASEAVLTIFVFFVWIAISYAFKERRHIRVTAIIGLLPPKAAKVLEIVINLAIIVFLVILVKTGIEYIQHPSVQGKTSLLLSYPMWLYYSSAPLGASLAIIRIIQNTVQDIKVLLTK